MTDAELTKNLEAIRSKMAIWDLIVHSDYDRQGEEIKYYITDDQVGFIRQILDLFRELNWQVHLNTYRQLTVTKDAPIEKSGCGTPVKLRSCREEHGDKTYFGILLGEIPLQITHRIDPDGNLTASRDFYNPAIFVPELNDIVFGRESWWGPIGDANELEALITDETIQNIWYVKLLRELSPKNKQSIPAGNPPQTGASGQIAGG